MEYFTRMSIFVCLVICYYVLQRRANDILKLEWVVYSEVINLQFSTCCLWKKWQVKYRKRYIFGVICFLSLIRVVTHCLFICIIDVCKYERWFSKFKPRNFRNSRASQTFLTNIGQPPRTLAEDLFTHLWIKYFCLLKTYISFISI